MENNPVVAFGYPSEGTLLCPFPFYKALRRDAPVCPVPGTNVFLVSRYEDIMEVTGRHDVFRSGSGPRFAGDTEIQAIRAQGWADGPILNAVDPPEHNRSRSAVAAAFVP